MGRLLFLFVVVPMVELTLLIEVGRWIGTLWTLVLILVTGVIGASLARYQGLQVWRRVQTEMAQGAVPAAALLDGVMILLAGAVLMTPGILTDAVGFSLLVPPVRSFLRERLRRRFESSVRARAAGASSAGRGPAGPGSARSGPVVIDVESHSEPPSD